MEYSKKNLTELSNRSTFIKDNLEKVLRLIDILKYINNDDYLKGKLALKGETAINLSLNNLPRLSVDIDLDYSMPIDKEELPMEKEKIKGSILHYANINGYTIKKESKEHYALHSLILSYKNNSGNPDTIKIEINYMNRIHILPLVNKMVIIENITEPFSVLMLNQIELYSSKLNALLSRATPRDLYDVDIMIKRNVINDYDMLRKCFVFYKMISGESEVAFDITKIKNINYMKVKMQLRPIMKKSDPFLLEEVKQNVISFLERLLIFEESETLFMNKFNDGIFEPNIIFDDDISKSLIDHPMAKWRISGILKSK